MRAIQKAEMLLGQIAIENIALDARCRDDVPAVLKGIQYIYCKEELRQEIFTLLENHILEKLDPAGDSPEAGRINRAVGRRGMDLWNILVLGLLKQGINCDYDRLHDLANRHLDVRRMLGLSEVFDNTAYSYRTLLRNVALLTPELLAAVNRLVVGAGHELVGHRPPEPLQARCDSFTVETDVHYPTDVSLLWDALRCLIRVVARACQQHNISGWRQSMHLTMNVRNLFNRVRSWRQRQGKPKRVQAYLRLARDLSQRARATLEQLAAAAADADVQEEIKCYLEHAERQIDQINRRILQGEVIPHEEKVFSIFEPHTRWCAKGKAGRAVELGVPVSVVESEHQFILEYLRSFGLFGLWQLWQSSGPGGRVHFMIAEKSSDVKVQRVSGLAESKSRCCISHDFGGFYQIIPCIRPAVVRIKVAHGCPATIRIFILGRAVQAWQREPGGRPMPPAMEAKWARSTIRERGNRGQSLSPLRLSSK